MPTEYTDEFYWARREGAQKSARVIVPLVLEYVQPRSVIDLGCGIGTWLSVFREYGVTDILGVDGDYVKKEMLEIPDDRFLKFDLRTPFRIDRQFDLVVSLEVAEHLPSECAEVLVCTLVGLGPVVLFSAAIPLQGGTNHINEQWPDYWATLFKVQGYIPIDPIRKRLWQNPDADFWYVQNTLIFVQRESLGCYPALRKELENAGETALSVVHPKMYLEMGRREVEKSKAEADAYRSKVEFFAAENEKQRAEAAAYRAQAEFFAAESEKRCGEVEIYKALAEPRNMGLKKLLRALPIVAVNAMKRRRRQLLSHR